MRRAPRVSLKGNWPAEAAEGQAILAYDDRRRRRLRLETDQQEAFLLDLPEPTILPDGAGLQLEDGGWIGVRAAPEPVAPKPNVSPAPKTTEPKPKAKPKPTVSKPKPTASKPKPAKKKKKKKENLASFFGQ